jgi:hypothetical protein
MLPYFCHTVRQDRVTRPSAVRRSVKLVGKATSALTVSIAPPWPMFATVQGNELPASNHPGVFAWSRWPCRLSTWMLIGTIPFPVESVVSRTIGVCAANAGNGYRRGLTVCRRLLGNIGVGKLAGAALKEAHFRVALRSGHDTKQKHRLPALATKQPGIDFHGYCSRPVIERPSPAMKETSQPVL